MALGNNRRGMGVFSNRRNTELALEDLRNSGFPMDKVSVIAKNVHEDRDHIAGKEIKDIHDNKADEGAVTGAAAGGALGALTGLLVGLGALAIPGIGPVMLAGATATAIATTLSGTAIGAAAGGLLGALIGLGIPEAQARVYHDRVVHGDYLVIIDGSVDDILRAEIVLRRHQIQEWGIYDSVPPDVDRDARRTDYTTDVPDVDAIDRRDRVIDPRDRVL